MSEARKTIAYVAAALALAGTAWVTAPRKPVPAAFSDRGQPFFRDFQDPNAAMTLEVVEFDDATASARPFKVTNQKGRWTIPSHHNYPADGKERLAKTAAAVIALVKDDVRTDNAADHEACGVVDPLETKAALKGRGRRVTIKGDKDTVLADLIVGKPVPERVGFRFVRLPGAKRVYAARMDTDVSTKFEDWIERDLLAVDRESIVQVTLEDYSIDEMTRQVQMRGRVVAKKHEGLWQMDGLGPSEELDLPKLNALLGAIDELSIVGVRRKPAGLSESLRHREGGIRISPEDMSSLQSRGYYFSGDGRLLSNEGEVRVRTSDGVVYTLRFGEIVRGRGEALTSGAGEGEDKDAGPGENRYLFITAAHDARLEGLVPPEGEVERQQRLERGEKTAARLNGRFADWYYVISAESFDKVHLRRKDLVRKKT